MVNKSLGLLVLILLLGGVGSAAAHVGAINLFVDDDNQLYPLETFLIPQFVEYLGIEISTDGPGFGVDFPSQGVEVDSSFTVDVAFELLYWDGFGLAPTASSISMEAPTFDNQGETITSPISEYVISAVTGVQTGINWGTYNGANFWEAHGLNFLTPLSSPAGIYGAVLRVNSSIHQATDPFVVPFVYDPEDVWDPDAEQVGIDRLRDTATAIRFADLNADGHVDAQDVDGLVAEIAAGTNDAMYDLTDDGVVNLADLDEWRVQAGRVLLPLGTSAILTGDANLDGTVDGLDFIAWNDDKFTSTAAWSSGDFNADGVVDGIDFIAWNDNKFTSAADGFVVVPEPVQGCVFLLTIAMLTLHRSRTALDTK